MTSYKLAQLMNMHPLDGNSLFEEMVMKNKMAFFPNPL